MPLFRSRTTPTPPPPEHRHLLDRAAPLLVHVQSLGREGLQRSEGIWTDFKDFIGDGNMMDLAVGIILGGAFSKIVDSLVTDLLLPPIGLITGVNFHNMFLVLRHPPGKEHIQYATPALAQEAGALTWNYGRFCSIGVDFILVGIALFLIVQALQQLKRGKILKEKKKCPYCRETIKAAATKCRFCASTVS